MKRFVLGFVGSLVGGFNIYLLTGTDAYSGNSLAVLIFVFIVSMAFIAYGIGGNAVLSRIPFVRAFSKPMKKGFLKDLADTETA